MTVDALGGAPETVEATERVAVEREFTVEAKTQRQLVIGRFLRHRLAMGSLAFLIGIVLLAFVGLRMWDQPFDAPGIVENRGQPTLDILPSFIDGDGFQIGLHPFGQDNIGRDYYAVTLRGAQQSILIALVAGLLATFIGTLIGGVSGYYRGMIDNVLMRFVDLMFTVPLLVIAAVVGRRFDSGIYGTALIIAVFSWMGTSRVIRAEFLSLREKEFVEAARALGASNSRIMWKHILPNVVGSIIVIATLAISVAILVETGLSYLGLGVAGSDWSLGKQVSQYQQAFNTRPWLFWWPGLFILGIALSINFIGDGLRDAFDPRQTRQRR